MSTSGRRRSFVPLACGLSCVNVLGPTKSTIKTRQRFAAIPKSGTRRAKIVRASSIPGGEASVCSPGLYFSNQKKKSQKSKIKKCSLVLSTVYIYVSIHYFAAAQCACTLRARCIHAFDARRTHNYTTPSTTHTRHDTRIYIA